MAEPRKADPPADWTERFLAEYSKTGNLSHSARKARVTRAGVYERRDVDPAFAKALQTAREEANDALEAEAHRRAVTGTLEPVFYKGAKIASIRRFSDTLLIVLLKANLPDKYKERRDITTDGQPIGALGLNELTDDELNSRLADAEGRKAP
jgi:hypothetical protein